MTNIPFKDHSSHPIENDENPVLETHEPRELCRSPENPRSQPPAFNDCRVCQYTAASNSGIHSGMAISLSMVVAGEFVTTFATPRRLVSAPTSLYYCHETLQTGISLLRIHHIDTLDIPDLKPYKTLRQTSEHRKQGIFVAEGEKVVLRLLESDIQAVSFLMTPEWFEVHRPALESLPGAIAVFLGHKSLLNSIVGFNLHQGIMAVARIPKAVDLGTIVRRSNRPLLFVAVDGMTNSENLGVLVRNCAAFGVQALLVGENSSSPYLRRAVRNSMGTIFKLPVVHSENLVGTLQELKSSFSVCVVAAHPRTEQTHLSAVDFRRDSCIVFGSEGSGISSGVLAACNESAAIPMSNSIDSLNVSNASAVFLYEVARQRVGSRPAV